MIIPIKTLIYRDSVSLAALTVIQTDLEPYLTYY